MQVADEQNPPRTELGVVCKHCSHTLLVPPLDAQLMPTGLDFARTQAVKYGMRCDIYRHILDNHEVLSLDHNQFYREDSFRGSDRSFVSGTPIG